MAVIVLLISNDYVRMQVSSSLQVPPAWQVISMLSSWVMEKANRLLQVYLKFQQERGEKWERKVRLVAVSETWKGKGWCSVSGSAGGLVGYSYLVGGG